MTRSAIVAGMPALALTVASCLISAARAETPQCTQALAKMRGELVKRANDMEIAIRNNAPTEQKCRLSAAYLAADEKVLAFMKSNQRKCGLEALVVAQQQAVHESNRRAKDVLCTAPRS